MSMSKQPSPQIDQPLAPDPAGGGWQTAVTLVLIAHLFAVVIGVLIYTLPLSPLRSKLADVPLVPQYLQLLHMDTAYNFHLTDGLESDLDHSVVIEREDVPQD